MNIMHFQHKKKSNFNFFCFKHTYFGFLKEENEEKGADQAALYVPKVSKVIFERRKGHQ